MRRVLSCLVSSFVCLGAQGAEKPIPQDAAKSARLSRERLEWNRRTLVGAYDKIGKKDPRWDAKARETLETAARAFSRQVDPVTYPEDIQPPAKAAIDAGCDDPMVVYLFRRGEPVPKSVTPEAERKRVKSCVEALATSRYPAMRRGAAHRVAGDGLRKVAKDGKSGWKDAQAQYDAALALLAIHDDDGPLVEDRWNEILHDVILGYRATGMGAVPAYEKVDAALAKAPWMEALRLKVRGRFWLGYGWEARTGAAAKDVPAGGFEKFEERSIKAREAFEKSWAVRPDAEVAAFLLNIDTALVGDRDVMETWFDRAIRLDPDSFAACAGKLDWLDPKWRGNWDEAIAFGRACRETGNWRRGISLLGATAHYRYANVLDKKEVRAYLSDPDVWRDIGPAFQEYLKHYPRDAVTRTRYAVLCGRAGRYAESHAQFNILGDAMTPWTDYPTVSRSYLEELRNFVGAKVETGAAEPADAKP